MATTGGSLPSSTPTFVLLTAPLVELLLALLDDSLALDLPPDLRASLLLPLQPVLLSPSTDGSVKPRDPEISYDLVRKTGNWCTSVEGKEELKKKGLDPSSYHPHALLSITRTTLPQGLRLPPISSSNPVTSKPSPYLPPSSAPKLEKSVGQEMSMGVGREVSAILNVGFSAGGVAGGVWWLGTKSYVGWSVEKTTVLSLLAFFFIVGVETTLYAIYFSKLTKHREAEAKAKAKWMAGGLTVVPLDEQVLLDEKIAASGADESLLVEEKNELEEEVAQVSEVVVEAPKGKGKSGREKVGRREGLRSRTAAGGAVAGVEKD
ncbi:hypothetical protein BDY24DRAFT_383478 [Mrakia frigida]|uniref:uncharacterized protein n=1 Tax=Mrakia frigida TaxID=29902 RepID=UPI003FCC1651